MLFRRTDADLTRRSPLRTVVGVASSRASGALRTFVLVWALGIGLEAQVFQIGNQVSTIIFEIFMAGTLGAAIAPWLAVGAGQNRLQLDSQVWHLLKVTVLATSVLAVGLVALAPSLAPLISEGNASSESDLARVIAISASQLPLYAISLVCSTALIFHGREHIAAWAPAANNVVFIVGLAVLVAFASASSRPSPASVAWLATAAVFAMAATPLLILIRIGWQPRKAEKGLPPLSRIRGQAMWALLSSTFLQSQFIVLSLATSGAQLMAATLTLQQIVVLPSAVLGYAFARPYIADVALEYSEGISSKAWSRAQQAQLRVLGLALISSVLIASLARPLVMGLEWLARTDLPDGAVFALQVGGVATVALTFIEYQSHLLAARRAMAPIAIARFAQLCALALTIGALAGDRDNLLAAVFTAVSISSVVGVLTLLVFQGRSRSRS